MDNRPTVEVCFTPNLYPLHKDNAEIVVVIDVLRATSAICTAFANGVEQNNDTIPEIPICKELGVALIDGLGEKIQSSSWLLENH